MNLDDVKDKLIKFWILNKGAFMQDYKISDEKIKAMIKNADEKENEIYSISPKCSLVILLLIICGLSYGFESLFIFKIILMLFIVYLPLKGMIFLTKSIIQNYIQKKM